jgi:uncharacterized protein
MDVTPLIRSDRQVIQSYAAGQFKVSGQSYTGAIIIFPEETQNWDAVSLESLTPESFELLVQKASEIDVVLLGCGAEMRFLPPELRKALKDKGLSVEIMPTGAACRTYNVLMAEGRRVVAALLPKRR